MMFRILVEANGNVGGVSVLDRVRMLPILPHDNHEREEGEKTAPIHVDNERLVRAGWFEVAPERNLRCDVLRLLIEGKGDRFDD